MSTHSMGADGFRWPLNFKGGDGTGQCPPAKWRRIARVLLTVVFLLFILVVL